MKQSLPLVSVIITTKNSASTIGGCLKSIRDQNYHKEKIEIIVVDNHSLDETIPIARKFADKIFLHGPERSAQRNFGTKYAKGKYVLYLDSDMFLSKDVVLQCVTKCENEDFVALYIPERITGMGFWIKVRDFERSFYNATCIDCVRFIRKDRFFQTGGFDESLNAAEDWDLDRRICKTNEKEIIDSPLYHYEGKFNLRKYLNKKTYYTRDLKKYIQKWGKNDKTVRKQLGFWYRYFWVFIENRKIFKLLSHPLLCWVMYFLRGLVGLRYILNQNKM
jgi:glycosyltransferase involved in cell wall biosynthesis